MNTLLFYCAAVLAMLFVLVPHEFAHAAVAVANGDPTPKLNGRLSLNPLRHFDPLGFVMCALVGFGWARPVPVNVSGFRIKNRKAGMAIVALAGPLSNLVLAFVSYIVALLLTYKVQSDAMFIQTVQMFFSYIGALSVGLGVFNLIPVHPLDGSRVLDAFLPYHIQAKLDRYQPIILLAVVAIVYFGLFDLVINRVDNWILNLAVRAVFPFL